MPWKSLLPGAAKAPWVFVAVLSLSLGYYAKIRAPMLQKRLNAAQAALEASRQGLQLAHAALDAHIQAQQFMEGVRVEMYAASEPYHNPASTYDDKLDLLRRFGGGTLRTEVRDGAAYLVFEPDDDGAPADGVRTAAEGGGGDGLSVLPGGASPAP